MYEELIKEARIWAPCAMSPVFQKNLITRLADALAARQPTEDDREALANVLVDAREGGDGLSATRNRILAAGFSRAATPDAAKCESCDREAAFCGHCTAEAVPDAVTELAQAKADLKTVGEVSRSTFDKLKAERDAALAAVERVRAIHKVTSTDLISFRRCACGDSWPCLTVSALDGA